MVRKLTLGKTRNTNTNRQVKILGKTHMKVLKEQYEGDELKEQINNFSNLNKLIGGDYKVLKKITRKGIILSDNEINKLFEDMRESGDKLMFKFKLTDGTIRYIAGTTAGEEELRKILNSNYSDAQDVELEGSDTAYQIRLVGISEVSIIKWKKPKIPKKNKAGNYFKYINTTDIDLTKYQIVRESDDFNILNENCLIYALRQYEITEAQINRIKLMINNGSYIPKNKLNKIADIIKKQITLHNICNTRNELTKQTYGKYDESIDIAIYEDHYFVYDKETKFSPYAVKHYNQLKDVKDFHKVIKMKKGKPEKSNKYKGVSSIWLIYYLHQQELFNGKSKTLTKFINNPEIQNIQDIPLDDIKNEQRKIKVTDEKEAPTDIFYADTECVVTEGNHWCLLTGIVKSDKENVKIFTYEKENPSLHIRRMLNYVYYNSKSDAPIVYFHNLKYDFNVLKQHVYVKNICEKSGSIYSVDIIHQGKTIIFKDSYKLFNSPLRVFCSTFGLPAELNKKEAIGYNFYNSETINQKHTRVQDYEAFIKPGEKKIFYEALKANKKEFEYSKSKGTFNAMNYYRYYLKYDCLVLKAGFEVLRQKMLQLTKLDIHNYLTISSLSNRYFKTNGSFNDVYEVSGNLREYISKAIVGGRVAVLESAKKKVIKKQLVDYDACSLYPSAIYRMSNDVGIPIGKCKRIKKYTKKQLDKYKYYIVTIKINKINKKQQIPFIGVKKDGILDYINEVPDDGVITVVDSITLEDYINFHQIEYEILDGVYWNKDVNRKFGEMTNTLYNARLAEKAKAKKGKTEDERKSGKIMQNLIKLMLNSAYGKTIISKTKSSHLIKPAGEKTNDYIYNNFFTIQEVMDLNSKQKIIKCESIDDSFNLAHVGVMVLSMSKRIMNEVMDVANDNNIKVYYQDTDSMHIERSRIKELEEKYQDKYNRVLNGKMMGNFHSDFDLDGADQEPYSTTSIFLGKKCYLDMLECVNKDGSVVKGEHIRLKGITQAGIQHQQQTKYNNSPLEMFKDLARGKQLEFILNPNEFIPSFNFKSCGVESRAINSFKRELVF
jgi:hypothetical protein